MSDTRLSSEKHQLLFDGTVIPAHPLALNSNRQLDERRQRALTRYYLDAGMGGVAVGVHTTQFAIRGLGLFEPVLRLAADTIMEANLTRPFLKIAGICGPTKQAVAEAELAARLGYDLGLVSLGGLKDFTEDELVTHIGAVSQVIPVFGFYLQPSVGGRRLSYDFWRQVADIPGVIAIKMAPFNRYQTLDVVRAVCNSTRRDEIALYTGNDDNIVVDLLTRFEFTVDGQVVQKEIVGGLLGHWSVWAKRVVELFEQIKAARKSGTLSPELLTLAAQITDANAAFFDPPHDFHGCIAGIHEVLRRQGLLEGTWCLDPHEQMSPGQAGEISRVYEFYPHLHDDAFVRENLDRWMK